MSDVSVAPESIIRVMPESLANKIAAGEVVQRPASALKEIVENALDAGAANVTVVVKGAGSDLLHVVDDGCGMSRSDARSCFRRHATSKISGIDDLEHIRTLGFRGEALASISAVSRVELRTKRSVDPAGYCVRVEGGEVIASESCATQDGTSVAVRNLFYNVPARRNFLKTPATEFRHVVETFQSLSVSNPDVAFTLLHDDMEMFRLPAEEREDRRRALRGRIASLFGADHAARVVPVGEQTSYLTVEGFVGEPELHKKSRGEQFLFVNGRIIRNRALEHAVFSAYADLIPEGAYPFYAIFLSLDPSRVDVNVHPAKAEVKFDDERGIYNFLKSVVRKGLGSALLSPEIGGFTGGFSTHTGGEHPRPAAGTGFEGRSRRPGDSPFGDAPARSPFGDETPGGSSHGQGYVGGLPGLLSQRLYERQETGRPTVGTRDEPDAGGDDALLWQLHDRYVLTQIRSGLMILDQNAAHERVLYERALGVMASGVGLSQQLLFPQTVEFGVAEFETLKELLPDLRALGFDVETFGGRSVVVRGVPTDVHSGDERTVLEDVLAQYRVNHERMKVRRRDNLAKSIARRSAIRSGTPLSAAEMRALIDQLFACEMPYACPDGRPTIVKIPIEELEKRFSK